MKKVELLSPAGDLETLKIAVHAGADAVYISGKDYGARKYAPNFTVEEIEEAVCFCHLYGVRLYVTVNTLIEESDISDVTLYIKKLYSMGVDAFIMQDIGMISTIKKEIPDIEIHASTQTHNCSLECVSFLENLGVSRVVLARELSLDEIKQIKTPLELEIFIHGALCASYSGQCLISSYLYDRSGNKGMCSQVCRFKFDLEKDNKKIDLKDNYLLSMKELCAGEKIKKLLDLNISSLKIEGRMKSKYYVGLVTKVYRTLIDKYYAGIDVGLCEEDYNKLLVMYNRQFTSGFLNNDLKIANTKTCNHRGIYLGKVLECGKKIKIKLDRDLNQGDGIRFSNGEGMIVNYLYNEQGLLINSSLNGSVIYVDNKVDLKENGEVFKTFDTLLNKEIEEYDKKMVPLKCSVTAKIGKMLSISFSDGVNEVSISSDNVDKALNRGVTKEDIEGKLSKLGNTPFVLKEIDYDIDDDIFIPLKTINNIRRELVCKLISIRENSKRKILDVSYKEDYKKMNLTNELSFLVRNESQLKYLLTKDVNIYVEDYDLYKKYNCDKLFYRNPRASFTYNDASKSLISNNGGLCVYNNKSIIDIYMNVKNSLTINAFSNFGYKIGLSPELKDEDLCYLMDSYYKKYNSYPNVEVLIYGSLELMLMKYCPIHYAICGENCKDNCNMCKNSNYYISNDKSHRFMLLKDENHSLRVMSHEKLNNLDKIDYYKKIGITNFRIDLLDEDEKEIELILDKLNI